MSNKEMASMDEIMKNTKIDDGIGRKNKSDKVIEINKDSIKAITNALEKEIRKQ